ncbi:hypothetical protein [Halalkalicoccus jeotgali]|uniref:Uncharacterized protein n=1 Tax=Halalkalicoccus jeotgali (strain DSM 18796 / CECT 7217 / JCM 14584 / KCTC 4019 / B3) TaxID=795797 RepID=D8J7A0_HALJB|nr:hypothetical protein [Halalkalicoccus jeotgali]ADJ13995.1 hypothetical protein HacjB3_03010 [Halalkalicoccus jeotgali B3]ELY33960.1 hypothetical protein C497_16302 [Halalkalicoccus jeotgali B3]
MEPDLPRHRRPSAATLGRWLGIALLVVFAVLLLPLPESPFFLGAVIAVGFWVLQRLYGRR